MRASRSGVVRALLGVWLLAAGALGACSDDDPPGPRSQAGSGGHGDGGEGAQGGTAGDALGAGAPSGGGLNDAGASSGGAPADAGAGGEGGAPAGGSNGEAGAAAAGGAGGVGASPPDLIISTGGPWPDSFTASCASPTQLIPCPQLEDPFFGQDGSYRINVPTYSGKGSVTTDSITGLMWQLSPPATPVSQDAAAKYCVDLELSGHDDWRLPTRLEYVSLLDQGLPGGFAVPPVVPNDTTGVKWTSSAAGATAGGFFEVNDELGVINVAVGTTPRGARCVRGSGLTGSVTPGTDTAVDSLTQLEWQRTNLDDTLRTWQEALGYCEALSHADRSDWRLPSIKELVTLVDETALAPPVVSSSSFGDSSASRLWSSTPTTSFSSERAALALDTDFGATPTLKMAEAAAAARCVRTAD